MTDTMLDRLTHALLAAEPWSSFWAQHDARDLVRAVLAELREPDAAMYQAGIEAITEGDVPGLTRTWQAMIDAALRGDA